MNKFYTTFQIAKICQVSPGSVVRWIHEGKLRASVTGGGHHRIQADDLIDFLQSLNMPLPPDLCPSKPIRILIADDEESVRRLLRKMIESELPQIQIDEAVDGFAAGWKASSFKPDIILLDIKMPGMDGLDVCRHLRASSEMGKVKIIMISGVPETQIFQDAMNAGANAFLAKPFTQDQLKEVLRRHIGEVTYERGEGAA